MKKKQVKIKPNKTTRKVEKIKTEVKDFAASTKKINIIDPAEYKSTWRTKFNLNILLPWIIFKKNLSYKIPYQIRDGWYKFKCFLRPRNKKYRAAIPNTWIDVCVLIENVNFAFIKGFYEDEYSKGLIDWNSDGGNQKFAKWLESSYKYITIERRNLEKQLDAAFPAITGFADLFGEETVDQNGVVSRTVKTCEERYGKPYEEVYAEVNRIEKLIQDKDTKVLTEIIKYRQYFWT